VAHVSGHKEGWQTKTTTENTMNEENKSYKAAFVIDDKKPKVKTLGLRLTVTDSNLMDEVKEAFNLAKTAGQELDLMFSQQPLDKGFCEGQL
jgi:hypothetical protein